MCLRFNCLTSSQLNDEKKQIKITAQTIIGESIIKIGPYTQLTEGQWVITTR